MLILSRGCGLCGCLQESFNHELGLRYGEAERQGRRTSMEDKVMALVDMNRAFGFDDGQPLHAFFAIYDGEYCPKPCVVATVDQGLPDTSLATVRTHGHAVQATTGTPHRISWAVVCITTLWPQILSSRTCQRP